MLSSALTRNSVSATRIPATNAPKARDNPKYSVHQAAVRTTSNVVATNSSDDSSELEDISLNSGLKNILPDIIIIDGIRSIHEINVLKQTGNVKLLAVHASSETRFNFLSERKRSDDPLTKEKFEERDNREIGVGLKEIIGLADEAIENNNVTIDEMVSSAAKIFQKWIE